MRGRKTNDKFLFVSDGPRLDGMENNKYVCVIASWPMCCRHRLTTLFFFFFISFVGIRKLYSNEAHLIHKGTSTMTVQCVCVTDACTFTYTMNEMSTVLIRNEFHDREWTGFSQSALFSVFLSLSLSQGHTYSTLAFNVLCIEHSNEHVL